MLWKLLTLLPRWIAAEHEDIIEEYQSKPIVPLSQWISGIIILLVIAAVVLL